jgi:hypothetical protein
VACLILKKQEEHIHGERGLTIPSASMRQWREREAAVQAGIFSILLYFNNIFFYILQK